MTVGTGSLVPGRNLPVRGFVRMTFERRMFEAMAEKLRDEFEMMPADAHDGRLARICDLLLLGENVGAADREYVFRTAWLYRNILPPELAAYAATGIGVCGRDEAGSGL